MAHAAAASTPLLIPISKGDGVKPDHTDRPLPATPSSLLQIIAKLHQGGVAWEDALEPVRVELERRYALLPPLPASPHPFPPQPLSLSDKSAEVPRLRSSPRSTSAPRRFNPELEKKEQLSMPPLEHIVGRQLIRTDGVRTLVPKVSVAVVGGQEELIQEGNATSLYALRPDPGPVLDWAAALRTGASVPKPSTSPPALSGARAQDRNIRFSGGVSNNSNLSPSNSGTVLEQQTAVAPPRRFRELMSDEYFALSFGAYLEGARAIELLVFYKEVEAFTALEDRPSQREKAFPMYQRFLASGGEREVNVDESVRQKVHTLLSTGDWVGKSLFAECQQEVVSLLETDFVPKFFRTETGAAYLNRPRSTRKSTLLGRLSLTGSDARPSSKIDPKGREGINTSGTASNLSPPTSPKGPAKPMLRNAASPRKSAVSPRRDKSNSPSPP